MREEDDWSAIPFTEPRAYIQQRRAEAVEERRAYVRGYMTAIWTLAVVMTACLGVLAVLQADYKTAIIAAAVIVGCTLVYAATICVWEAACAPSVFYAPLPSSPLL